MSSKKLNMSTNFISTVQGLLTRLLDGHLGFSAFVYGKDPRVIHVDNCDELLERLKKAGYVTGEDVLHYVFLFPDPVHNPQYPRDTYRNSRAYRSFPRDRLEKGSDPPMPFALAYTVRGNLFLLHYGEPFATPYHDILKDWARLS